MQSLLTLIVRRASTEPLGHLIRLALSLLPTQCPSNPHSIRGTLDPSRGFLPWRLPYAGPRCVWLRSRWAGIRNPSHKRACPPRLKHASSSPKSGPIGAAQQLSDGLFSVIEETLLGRASARWRYRAARAVNLILSRCCFGPVSPGLPEAWRRVRSRGSRARGAASGAGSLH